MSDRYFVVLSSLSAINTASCIFTLENGLSAPSAAFGGAAVAAALFSLREIAVTLTAHIKPCEPAKMAGSKQQHTPHA